MAKAKTDVAVEGLVEVIHASLKSAEMIPGIGTERNLNVTRIPTIKMSWDGTNLMCQAKGKSFIVPGSNVCLMMLS